jgi:ATP-binding cassette subfamily G (WHITE) protein 2 (SNQ2)
VYAIGFGKGAAGLNGTGFQFLIVLFMLLFGISLGQLIASISPSVQVSLHVVRSCRFYNVFCQVAVLFNPFIGWFLVTFCGITIPYPTLIHFWKSWMYQFDPYTRAVAAAISTELQYVFSVSLMLRR